MFCALNSKDYCLRMEMKYQWIHFGKEKCNSVQIVRNLLIQSAKILLLPPKYEIIMLPSNHSFFQNCDSNIGLFSIAPCKVINFNPFCILFGTSSLLLFWWLFLYSYRSSNYRDSDSCRSFSLLKAIAKRLQLLFANAFKSVKERQLLLSQ